MKRPFFHLNKHVIILLSIALILCLIAFKLIYDARINKITIYGNENVSTTEIYAIAKPYIGKNTFTISIDTLQNNIKRKIPYIQNVWIKKDLPSNLTIQIQEYKPIAIINYQNKNYVVNQNGLVLSNFNQGEYFNLPLIQSNTPINQVPIMDITKISSYLNNQGQNWAPKILEYNGNLELEIIYPNWTVILLTNSNIADKFKNISYIYYNLGPDKCPILDIRFSNNYCQNSAS